MIAKGHPLEVSKKHLRILWETIIQPSAEHFESLRNLRKRKVSYIGTTELEDLEVSAISDSDHGDSERRVVLNLSLTDWINRGLAKIEESLDKTAKGQMKTLCSLRDRPNTSIMAFLSAVTTAVNLSRIPAASGCNGVVPVEDVISWLPKRVPSMMAINSAIHAVITNYDRVDVLLLPADLLEKCREQNLEEDINLLRLCFLPTTYPGHREGLHTVLIRPSQPTSRTELLAICQVQVLRPVQNSSTSSGTSTQCDVLLLAVGPTRLELDHETRKFHKYLVTMFGQIFRNEEDCGAR